MAVVKQEGNFIPEITQQSLNDGLKVALTAAGYGAVYAEFDQDGLKHLVYQVVNNASKVFGTVYLHIRITEYLEIGQRLHTSFDTTTNTGLNSTDYNNSNSLSQNNTVRWIALNGGAEFKWVMLYQGYEQICLGMIRPFGMPSYWNENIAPYALVSDVSYNPLRSFYLPDVTPYRNNSYVKSSWDGSIVSNERNPFNSEIDIITGLIFAPYSKEGLYGLSSSLIGLATDDQLTIGDFIAIPSGAEYCAIAKYDGTAAVVVRTKDAI